MADEILVHLPTDKRPLGAGVDLVDLAIELDQLDRWSVDLSIALAQRDLRSDEGLGINPRLPVFIVAQRVGHNDDGVLGLVLVHLHEEDGGGRDQGEGDEGGDELLHKCLQAVKGTTYTYILTLDNITKIAFCQRKRLFYWLILATILPSIFDAIPQSFSDHDFWRLLI